MGMSGPGLPSVSAVICTRNRGDRVVQAIRSVLANDHSDFELIVIDQSESRDTRDAVEPFLDDHRVRYLHSDEVGIGRSRNLGLALARGKYVAYTDDDVTVPPAWLRVLSDLLDEHPKALVAFCSVVAAPHDSSLGFVPDYLCRRDREISTALGKCRARGIGAGMIVRRAQTVVLGGFDPVLQSCEDGDLAMRAILDGWHVFETGRVEVVHDGFRTWHEGRELTRRDLTGIGLAFAKPIRTGHLRALPVVVWEGIVLATLKPLRTTARTRRFSGVKQSWYFWRSFGRGLRHPIDPIALVYRPDRPSNREI